MAGFGRQMDAAGINWTLLIELDGGFREHRGDDSPFDHSPPSSCAQGRGGSGDSRAHLPVIMQTVTSPRSAFYRTLSGRRYHVSFFQGYNSGIYASPSRYKAWPL